MEFAEWEIYYKKILEDFDFSREEDENAAGILAELLKNKQRADEQTLEKIIKGKDAYVVGGAGEKDTGPDPPIHIGGSHVIIAADGATSNLLQRGFNPDIIITDLDGNVDDQVYANTKGSVVLIHAHGDNIEVLKKWVPRFSGQVMGTTQSRPFGAIRNFGGFTDGDRAVFLASHFGAKRIRLVNFDFENAAVKEKKDAGLKKRKLDWAYILISQIEGPEIVF